MPIYNIVTFNTAGQVLTDPNTLIMNGPILPVEISVPIALATYLTQNNLPIPQPITGIAQVDTGAYRTCVDSSTIQRLGVQAVGLQHISTPSGGSDQNLFPSHIKFPGTSIDLDFNETLGADLSGQIYNGQPLIALVGRDVLSGCVLIYNGVSGMFTLAH